MIREFFYVNSQGQQVGPVLFENLKSLPVTSTTLVWFPGQAEWKRIQDVPEFLEALYGSFSPPPVPPQINSGFAPDSNVYAAPAGDDTRMIGDAEETQFVYPQRNVSARPEARPKLTYGQSAAPSSAGTGLSLKTLILILVGAALVLTAILWPMIPRIASAFDSTPKIMAIIFGALIIVGAVFAALYSKSKSAKIALIVAGVLIGAAQLLISYERFGNTYRYKNGFLQKYNVVYDKWGNEILSTDKQIYRIDGEKGACFMTCYLTGYDENAEIELNAYDEEGDRVIHETLDIPNDYKRADNRAELEKELIKYLESEYKIVIEDNFQLY